MSEITNPPKPKVQIAYIHGENVSHSFLHSLLKLSNTADPDLFTKDTISALSSPLSIPEARNELMEYFLDKTDATHIWWIDTDMGFAPDTVANLLQANKDVIGALCKGMTKTDKDGFGGYLTEEFITAYDLSIFTVEADETEENKSGEIKDGKEKKEILSFTLKQDVDLEASEPIQVAGTGTAALLISRGAAMAVQNFYGRRWFERVHMPTAKRNSRGHIIGEDLSFCYRLATIGIPVFIHPKVKTTHAKTVWLQ